MKIHHSKSTHKPKGPTPSLISGKKPKKVKATGKSKCARCKKQIILDDPCFKIPQVGWSILSPKKYCIICFNKILDKTQQDLDKIKNL